MSQAAIIEKLRVELSQHFERESQVVYILVEIRKFLEQRQDSSSSNSNPALNFYCDWAMHSKLDRRAARELLDKVSLLFEKTMNGPGLNHIEHDEMSGILTLDKLRDELSFFFEEQGLQKDLTDDDSKWQKFIGLYSHVIEDCPLECGVNDDVDRSFDKIVLRKVSPDEFPLEDQVPADFSIAWQFFNSGQSLGLLVLPKGQLLGSRFYQS